MSTIAHAPPSTSRPLRAPADRLIAGVRAAWRRSVLLRALVIGPALFAAAAVALVLIDLLIPLRAVLRETLRWLPPLMGAGWIGYALYRILNPPPPRRFALLAEERIPALENRLLTAFDMAETVPDGVVHRAFVADTERRLQAAGPRGVAPLHLRTPATILALSIGIAALFALAFPGAAREALSRWMHPADAYASKWREVRANTLPAVPPAPMPMFDEFRWRVQPPAYAGLAVEEGRGDEPVSALPGSHVRLRSRFPGRWDAVRASAIGGAPVAVRREGEEWVVDYTMPADAKGLTLEAVASGETIDRRVVPLIPLPDQAPDVQLLAPDADLVLAQPSGRLTVRASAGDDYGVGAFWLHWTRSRGSGESYEFTEGDWQFTRVARNGRTASGDFSIDLATLGLQAGDVMHLRATARDRNDVTGPGESVSRTRIVRIARPDEFDQVNTDLGLPSELPKDPVLSQRMIILMTERLVRDAPRMQRAEVQARSNEIAREQGRLREVVGEQIYIRGADSGVQPQGVDFGYLESGGGAGGGHAAGDSHGAEPAPAAATEEATLEAASEATGQGTIDEVSHKHDEGDLLDVNRSLLTLHNLMWSAEGQLKLIRPDSSLPHQYEALRMIQAMQRAERVFPRGNVAVDPINVAEARGQGKMDDVGPVARTRGAALASLGPLLAELDRVAAGIGRRAPRQSALEVSALAARALEAGVDRQAAALISQASGEAGAGRVERARDLLRRARGRLSPSAGAGARPLPSTADPAAAEYFRRIGRGG
ncbi:MAG TPA: hypothetical protein VF665_01065 [Longimicrobium sp.]|jgi:hypothetical protein|uniref:hypothetical protein n=1 Tax=Longimicrobium sp. TaxID=2029185 RepID=UPI002ED93C86